ncbi:LPS-assembly protein LptD [Endozoicomonas sp.]|nr:LPS-assembly protein LptD [Endozoicomonas sp.]
MEMHPIPFKPRTLALAITASLLASQPALRAYASEVPDNEWNCVPATDGSGWQCTVMPKTKSVMKRAFLPAPLPNATATNKISVPDQTIKPEKKRVATTAIPAKTSAASVQAALDWVPVSQLTPAQRARQPSYICGAYIEPERPGKYFTGNPDTQPIIAEADSSNYDQASIATLMGNVRIQQASMQFESDKVTFDKDNNYASFEGHTRIREPGLLIIGDRGSAQFNTGEATVENATYVVHESNRRGQADTIVLNKNETIVLTNATYTSCPPGDGGWLLSGENVKLNPSTGFGTAHNATIKVEGLPIFYSPYLYFPIDSRRQSGFLYPTAGYSSDNGMEVSTPYYFNLAPNYDATLTPRLLTKRGLLLETEGRYLTEKNKGELGVTGLAGKDKLQNENPYYDKERWLVNWQHTTQLTPRWDINVDYADASDKNYLNDFSSDLNLSNSSVLNQNIRSHYIGGDASHDWQFLIDAHKYKNMSQTADDPYNKLPQLELQGNWFANDHLTIGYLADYTQFSRADNWRYLNEEPDPNFDPTHDVKRSVYDNGYGISRAEGERMYLENGASFPMHASYGYLTPEVKVRHVQYQLNSLNKDDVVTDLNNAYGNFTTSDYTESPKTTVASFSLDSGLYFDRQTSWGSTPFTHTLEPRMKYLYSPHVKDQEMNPVFDSAQLSFSYSSLWRDNRFSGYDRLADANQLSLGLTTRLIEEDGFERVRFGIGQILYFKDRNVYISPTAGSQNSKPSTDPNDARNQLLKEMESPVSPLASELVYNINRDMSLLQDVAWNTHANRIDNYGLYYRYFPAPQKVFNVGYRYRDQVDRYKKDQEGNNLDPLQKTSNNLSQTDSSFAWPINNRWSGFGRWQYDLTNNRNLELLSGVEYNSCCYQIRLLWRSWVDATDDNIDHPAKKSGVFLQFVLRGLGGLSSGGSVTEYLKGIQSYNTEYEK